MIDTATILLVREALDVIESRLVRLGDELAARAEACRDTVMPGRTLLQHALPITFGLKCAGAGWTR